jgi:hypothetical protein
LVVWQFSQALPVAMWLAFFAGHVAVLISTEPL